MASAAQKAAETCSLPYRRTALVRGYRSGVGINAFISELTSNLDVVVDVWYSGRRYYNHRTNKCYPGKDCSDYTQVSINVHVY